MRVGDDEDDDRTVENREVADNAEHRPLLATLGMGEADQFRSTAEICVGSGRCHLGRRPTAAHQPAGPGGLVGAELDRHRLPGQSRLVDRDEAFDDADIGRNDAAQSQAHQITRDQRRGQDFGPAAIAPDKGLQCEARFERRERHIGAFFLKGAERYVERQQSRDDQCLDTLAGDQLEDNRGLEHPRHRFPKSAQDADEQRHPRLGDRVRSGLRQAPRRFL